MFQADVNCVCAWLCDQGGLGFTPGFMTNTLLSWINNKFCIAAVLRELLVSWTSCAIDRLASLDGGGIDPLEADESVSEMLARLLPHEATLAGLIRTIWKVYIQPALAAKDAVTAQLDGCVLLRCGVVLYACFGLPHAV